MKLNPWSLRPAGGGGSWSRALEAAPQDAPGAKFQRRIDRQPKSGFHGFDGIAGKSKPVIQFRDHQALDRAAKKS